MPAATEKAHLYHRHPSHGAGALSTSTLLPQPEHVACASLVIAGGLQLKAGSRPLTTQSGRPQVYPPSGQLSACRPLES